MTRATRPIASPDPLPASDRDCPASHPRQLPFRQRITIVTSGAGTCYPHSALAFGPEAGNPLPDVRCRLPNRDIAAGASVVRLRESTPPWGVTMIWAILAILGVPLWLCAAGISRPRVSQSGTPAPPRKCEGTTSQDGQVAVDTGSRRVGARRVRVPWQPCSLGGVAGPGTRCRDDSPHGGRPKEVAPARLGSVHRAPHRRRWRAGRFRDDI